MDFIFSIDKDFKYYRHDTNKDLIDFECAGLPIGLRFMLYTMLI